jgi:hypothetical protein
MTDLWMEPSFSIWIVLETFSELEKYLAAFINTDKNTP